jgi:hypothetical protein
MVASAIGEFYESEKTENSSREIFLKAIHMPERDNSLASLPFAQRLDSMILPCMKIMRR